MSTLLGDSTTRFAHEGALVVAHHLRLIHPGPVDPIGACTCQAWWGIHEDLAKLTVLHAEHAEEGIELIPLGNRCRRCPADTLRVTR